MLVGQVVEGIEDSAALIQAAFALQDGEVSQPTSIGNRFVVLKLLERTASTIPPFEEAKDIGPRSTRARTITSIGTAEG